MKPIKLLIFCVVMALCHTAVFGQDASFYKQQIEECLSRGDCDKAQIMYDAWRELSGIRDADYERRIDDCKNSSKRTSITIIPDYVEINGIKWATRNVGVSGWFVSKPEDSGGYFTFNDAQSACPAGWRTPTGRELESLSYVHSIWTYINGVGGREFGSGDDTIFFPAAGFRRSSNSTVSDKGDIGSHWSSTKNSGASRRRQDFDITTVLPVDNPHRGILISVRCVRQ